MLLHTDFFTHTHSVSHTKTFTPSGFYIQTFLHTDTFTHRHFYTQTLLHTDAFTPHSSVILSAFAHTDAFTHTLVNSIMERVK